MASRAGSAAKASRALLKQASSPTLQQQSEISGAIGLFMLPGVMVPPSIVGSLRQKPVDGAKLQWARLKTRVTDAMRIFGMWAASKPGLLKAPQLAIKRGAILPTAKALHRTMSEALASGDKDTLRRVCVPALYNDLAARLARRPKGKRYAWSLLRYTHALRHPRIVDHKLAALPSANGKLTIMHQVVVAISSRQRLVQHDDSKGGVPVPGSEKEVDLVENLILIRPIDMSTYKAGDWAIFGHAEETTYEGWLAEERALDQLEQRQQ